MLLVNFFQWELVQLMSANASAIFVYVSAWDLALALA